MHSVFGPRDFDVSKLSINTNLGAVAAGGSEGIVDVPDGHHREGPRGAAVVVAATPVHLHLGTPAGAVLARSSLGGAAVAGL